MAWANSFVTLCVIFVTFIIPKSLCVNNVNYQIVEELSPGTFIGNIKTDAGLDVQYDVDVLKLLRFSILPPDNDDLLTRDYFRVEETTGMVKVNRVIDRDDVNLCAYQTVCYMTVDIAVGPALYFEVINVKIEILDINDNSPDFSQSEFRLNISESAVPGTLYNLPSVYDPDSEDFGIQRFDIKPSSSYFDIVWSRDLSGHILPKLELRNVLDRELIDIFDLSVIAYDNGSPANSAQLLVRITIQDTNDNSPEFALPTYEARINEDIGVGAEILTIHAEDPDIGSSGTVRYRLSAQNLGEDVDKFRIDPVSGSIYLINKVDREEHDVYYLSVIASDQGQVNRQATASVTIFVDDVNDNAPVIRLSVISSSGRVEVSEAAEMGTFVALVSVTDLDWGQNAEVNCRINSNKFLLQTMLPSNKFKIVTNAYLDREDRNDYQLAIICQDKGYPQQTGEQSFDVFVVDANDHSPVFTQDTYNARISEGAQKGTSVMVVSTTDMDIGGNGLVTYTLLNDYDGDFVIEPHSGIIRTNAKFDFETLSEARIRVQAQDQGTPAMTATCIVVIQITDINDEPPKFVDPSYTFAVRENQTTQQHIGSVLATDKDTPPNDRVIYSISSDSAEILQYFTIDNNNGSISLLRPLDREKQPFYHFKVVATNTEPPQLTGTVTVTIYVDDVNDNPPTVDFPSQQNNTVHISSRLPPGYKVTQIRAHDLDSGENADLSYFLVQTTNNQQRFGIDPKSGEVFLNHDLSDVKSESYNVKILVKDNGLPELSTTAKLTVIVNQSLAVPRSGPDLFPSEEEKSSNNMLIIIIVVATSGVIIIILLGSIVFVLISSRRKTPRSHESLTSTTLVMESLEAENPNPKTTEGTADQNGKSLTGQTINPDDITFKNPSFQRYIPLSNKPSLNISNSGSGNDVKPPMHPGNAPPVPPRGVFVNYQTRSPLADTSFTSDTSEQKEKKEHQHPAAPCPVTAVPEIDRESASSTDDSTADSGRGPSEEGDPTSVDDHGFNRPPSRRILHSTPDQRPYSYNSQHGPQTKLPAQTRKEVILSPDYGLSQLQTKFDPHYSLKYTGVGPCPPTTTQYNDVMKPYYTQSNDATVMTSPEFEQSDMYNNNSNFGKQTVRDVKAKDKNKKMDNVSLFINNSSLMKRYSADENIRGSNGANHPPTSCNFRDSTSLMNYKVNSRNSWCPSEVTDATSETSATSGSYILDHDHDISQDPSFTVSSC